MRILPARLHPPASPTRRRHRPRVAPRWADYRDCLRWDFGFTCPFCLLHEADFHGGSGAEGLGTFTIEHWRLRSAEPSKALDYENCLLACRLCNRARSKRPNVSADGRRLLDPAAIAWGHRFELTEVDELAPRAGDRDAFYTWESYDLDDPRKLRRRRLRRELIGSRLRLRREFLEEERELLAAMESWPQGRQASAFRLLALARRELAALMEDLRRFAVVPLDAPRHCRCDDGSHAVPAALEAQLLDLEDMY